MSHVAPVTGHSGSGPRAGVEANAACSTGTSGQTPRWLERSLQVGLSLWVAGALATEVLASLGAGVTLVALLVFWFRSGAGPGVRAWIRHWSPLLVFLLWGLLVTLVHWPLRGSAPIARHLDWLGVPVAAAAALQLRGSAWRPVLVTAGVLLLLGCLAAGLQYFGLWPSPETLAGFKWTRATVHRLYEPIPGSEGRFMGVGLHLHRLKFAHAGGLAVLWAFAMGLHGHGRGRWASLVVASVGFLSIAIFPLARAATFALCVGMAVAVWGRREALRLRLVVGVTAALVLLIGSVLTLQDSFRMRLASSLTGRGSGERPLLLKAGLDAVRSHPLFGTGIGRFRVGEWVAAEEAPEHVRTHSGKSHNLLLTAAAETGIPGMILLVVLLVWVGRQLNGSTLAGAGGLSTLAFIVALGLVHDPLHHAEVSLGAAFALGAALGQSRLTRLTRGANA